MVYDFWQNKLPELSIPYQGMIDCECLDLNRLVKLAMYIAVLLADLRLHAFFLFYQEPLFRGNLVNLWLWPKSVPT